jgi:hypothetical protein
MSPEPKLIQFVDKPYDAVFSDSGSADVKLDGKNYVMSINGFRKVCLQIAPVPKLRFELAMGKISGNTLCATVGKGDADRSIHSFDVVGPEMVLTLWGGVPKTTAKVQLWVYFLP